MKLSKPITAFLIVILFSGVSFLTGIQFERTTSRTNFPPTEITQTPNPPAGGPQLPQSATATRVIDGDTIELSTGQTVRYTGIAAPEKDEPYYQESADLNQKLTLGKRIRLEYEKGYEQDKFGRLLTYVFISNNPNSPNSPNLPNKPAETFVNLELVKASLAKVTLYEKRRPLIYQDQFLQAQKEAQKNKRAVWEK